jgi:hypothetical protein
VVGVYDPKAIRATTFADMVRLCRLPAWKDWAWREVQRMDEDALFAGIKAHVLEEMKNGAIK